MKGVGRASDGAEITPARWCNVKSRLSRHRGRGKSRREAQKPQRGSQFQPRPPSVADVWAATLADCKRSGLTKLDAEKMKLVPLDPDQLRERTRPKTKNKDAEGIVGVLGGYVITYFTPDGRPIDEAGRIRLLPTPAHLSSSGEESPPPIRYWQRAKSAPRVYFPPNRPWHKIIRDPSKSVIIVEGEKKGYRGNCEKGLNVISLGGVWSFQSKRLGIAFLRELEMIDWRGRVVYICYDSDALENEQVLAAETHFAEELSRRGASVYIIRLTSAADGSKRGLDDLLEQEGRAAFDKLMKDATRFAGRFDAMNRDFMVIESLAKILKIDNGRLCSFGDLKNVVGAKYAEHVLTKDGLKDVDLVKPWLACATHNEVTDMVFEPAREHPIYIGDNGLRYYNRFRGFSVTPEDGDITPWMQVVEHVFTGLPPKDFAWFIDWLAYKAQNPAGKLTTAVVLIGESGIGKSIIGEVYGKGFAPAYAEIQNEDLKSQFNADWLADKLFILGNEISAPDRRADADKIKNMITQEFTHINDTFGSKWIQKKYATYLLTSNHHDPLMIRANERRFQMFGSLAKPPPFELFARLIRWRDNEHGVARLLNFMLNHRISSSFNPTAPAFDTEAKILAVRLSETVFDTFAQEVMADSKSRLGTDVEVFDINTLLSLFDPEGGYRSAHKSLASALSHAGAWYTGKQIRTGKGVRRLWVVRNIAYWKKQPTIKLAREYERYEINGITVNRPPPKKSGLDDEDKQKMSNVLNFKSRKTEK